MKKLTVILLVLCLLAVSGLSVGADLEPRGSFEEVSRDGTRIFRYYAREEGREPFAAVYNNNEQQSLVYRIEGFFLDSGWRVYFSDDMSHLVKGSFGISFYVNGSRVGHAERYDFIDNYNGRLPCEFGSLIWAVNWRKTGLNSDTLQFTIDTDEGRTIVFDMTSGEILPNTTQNTPTSTTDWWLYITIAIVIIAFIAGEVIYFTVIKNRLKEKEEQKQ
ncbi:MAG: hypothetical protein FWB93_02055 [Oscillospiraceae bacterium]|nr:hypothetical protein [Oscillospiraceae bacterium]